MGLIRHPRGFSPTNQRPNRGDKTNCVRLWKKLQSKKTKNLDYEMHQFIKRLFAIMFWQIRTCLSRQIVSYLPDYFPWIQGVSCTTKHVAIFIFQRMGKQGSKGAFPLLKPG